MHGEAYAGAPPGTSLVLETRNWPRWSFEASATAPAGALRLGVRGGDELERRHVAFGDRRWRVHAIVAVPDPNDDEKTQDVELSFEHDLRDPDHPRRRVVGLPPRPLVRAGANRLAADFRAEVSTLFRSSP